MGSEKKETAAQIRRETLLRMLQRGDSISANQMAKRYNVSKETIVKDIAFIRSQGYPVQKSRMIIEDGQRAAQYELPKYRPKS